MEGQCTGHNQLECNKEKYPVSVIICILPSFNVLMFSQASVILCTVYTPLPPGRHCLLGRHLPRPANPSQGRHPPWANTPLPGRHPPLTATAADGTHPTGMHSCFCNFTAYQNPLLLFLSSYHHNIHLIKFITQKFKPETDIFVVVIIKSILVMTVIDI